MINNHNLDPYEHIDGRTVPNFELTGREERNAKINEGSFRFGGVAISSAQNYDLQGLHSVSREDVVDRPTGFTFKAGRHAATHKDA